MRFSSGVDQLQRENSFLKRTAEGFLILNAVLMFILYNLYDKAPLVVERSSRGLEIVKPTSISPTEAETRAAVALMLKARFNTGSVSPEIFLNPKQLLLRDSEQKELKSRGMEQNILVRNIVLKKDEVTVDIDRVISVGELRSALKTKLKISFEEEQPNELNPYGLLLALADPLEPKQDK